MGIQKMLESQDARRRFNETFHYGRPFVDGPWDFGMGEDASEAQGATDANADLIETTRPGSPDGASDEKASELAAIPGIVPIAPEASGTNIAASTRRPRRTN